MSETITKKDEYKHKLKKQMQNRWAKDTKLPDLVSEWPTHQNETKIDKKIP